MSCIKKTLEPLDFILITGDISDKGQESTYLNFFDLLIKENIKYYPLIGNHDSRDNLKKFLDKNLIDKYGYIQYKIFGEYFELICLDTVENNSHKGFINNEKLDFLEGQIKTSKKEKFLIVAMHHNPMKIGIKGLDKYQLANAYKLKELFEKTRKPDYLLYGHVHRNLQGIWNGIPYRSQKGINHQISRNVTKKDELFLTLEDPEYTYCSVESNQIHFDNINFFYKGPFFRYSDKEKINLINQREWISGV